MAKQQGPKSVKRDIIISVGLNQTQVAILEDGKLVEFMVDRDSETRMVGDIYKAVVRKVLPGMQAAFVDLGLPRQGFLHVSDVGNELFTSDVEEDGQAGDGSRRKRRRKVQTIQDQLKEGQEILVQVVKEPIGTKGPRVSTDISIPGRLLVYAPFDNRLGISRKIENPAERARIRETMRKIITSAEGVIVRTVAADTSQTDLKEEYQSLKNLWRRVKRQASQATAPSIVYQETKLISSLLRDVFTERVDSLVVDDKDEHKRIKEYLRIIAPNLTGRLKLYKDPEPVTTRYGLDEDIRRIFHRKVWLKSGGYIVIEQTEALVSIDVNTGRYTGEKNQEETILRTNLDAARQIARQLRLRDLGGIIVCDFIDMESRNNRQAVLDEMRRCLKYDRSRTKAFEVSSLGLVEISRQRVRPSLFHSLTEVCPACNGRGRVFTPEALVSEIERVVKKVAPSAVESGLLIRVHPVVALHLMEQAGDVVRNLENHTGITLQLRDDPLMRVDSIAIFSLSSNKEIVISC